MTTASIRPSEAEHFGRLAADWWNPKGSSAMLHRLNPPRLAYIRAALEREWGIDPATRRPLEGKRALDVGCGAGLLAEPLARMGASVIGIDAASETVAAARSHAAGSGIFIDYRQGDITDGVFAQAFGQFDLVTSLEVVEHVEFPARFVAALAERLTDTGVLVLSTPNRTAASRAIVVGAAELTGAVPRGTHDWERFITPDELRAHVESAGLRVTDVSGLSFDLTRGGFCTGGSVALNYLMTAVRV